MTSAAVRSRPYLDTVPDWELKYVHMLASSVHTPIRVPCKLMHVCSDMIVTNT
jgi:hypothetical protein